MPSLADHHGSQFVKIFFIGDSGTGKTGALTSLVAAGYKVRVLDMDNNLDVLRHYVREQCPDKIANVDFETLRDAYKATAQGPVVAGAAKAFVNSLKLLEKWGDGTDPATWGPNTILVVDSLSAMSRAAFDWAKGMNPSAKEPRTWFYAAQQAIESTIALLTNEAFHCNVIVISHIRWSETQTGERKGYPNSLGAAQGPILPRYFGNLILAESSGSGKNVKRHIKTMRTETIDLKTATPKVDQQLPLETGLATLFQQLKATTR